MGDLRTQQKAEALNRLRILQMKYGLMETVINEFEKEDTIYYSEYINSKCRGILYWISNNDEYVEVIKKFEEKNNALVYHAILTPMQFGNVLSLLYVSNNKEEWQADRNEVNDGILCVYCKNLDDDNCSEFGCIQIVGANGGIDRTA